MSYQSYQFYKDSKLEWLGDLPEHWSVGKLKSVAAVMPSNVDKKTNDGELPISLCNYVDVYYNENITQTLPFMKASASIEQIRKFQLKSGDTVITKDSEDPNDIAVAAYVPQDLDEIVCGYHLAVIRPKSGTLGHYLKRFLETRYAKSYFATRANGLTRYGLGTYPIKNLWVALPPLPEQKAIATFLDRETAKIDELIAKKERLIDLLEEKRQAVISHAVTKGLNPDAPMKDSGVEWLGDVPEHWEVKRTGLVFAEKGEKPKNESELGYPILSVSIHHGISDRELDDDELDRKVARSEDRSLYKVVRKNDLAYNMMRAWQGGFGASTTHGLISPAYFVCEPKSNLDSFYFELVLRTPNAVTELWRYSKGITDFRLRLYWDEFKNICLPVPPASEINEVLLFIKSETDTCNRLIEKLRASIAISKEHRTALISAAVTGKIDVRGLGDEEAA